MLGLALATPSAAEPFDEALYAEVLERYTADVDDVARVRVDYAGLAHSAEWPRLVAQLERTRPAELENPAAEIAYWLNAYNILAIDLVVRSYPVESIRDVGPWWRSVWKLEAGRIDGRGYGLDEIEHGILRPMGDPRVHVGIVCASVSCPALRREPWTAGRIDAQLEDGLRRWLADSEKGARLEREQGALRLSRIFDWFAGDFGPAGGVRAFVSRHLDDAERAWLARSGGDLRLVYFDYDWSLNDLARGGARR